MINFLMSVLAKIDLSCHVYIRIIIGFLVQYCNDLMASETVKK